MRERTGRRSGRRESIGIRVRAGGRASDREERGTEREAHPLVLVLALELVADLGHELHELLLVDAWRGRGEEGEGKWEKGEEEEEERERWREKKTRSDCRQPVFK